MSSLGVMLADAYMILGEDKATATFLVLKRIGN
ncbi:hypothetical protein ABIE60_003271 [Marinobacterium sp. MBR-109]|jgi:hypothetical protein